MIQVAENDVLRDEGEAYGRKLLEAGVKATTVRYNGVIHDFGHISIILLMAKNSLNSKIEGLEVGADAFYNKPRQWFNLLNLYGTILR